MNSDRESHKTIKIYEPMKKKKKMEEKEEMRSNTST